eukprot:gene854-3361_t
MRRMSEIDLGSNEIPATEGVMAGLCALFAHNSALAKVKLEDNPVGDAFPGGMFTRAHAEEMCPGGLPVVEPFPLRRAQGQGRAAASALTSQAPRKEDPEQAAIRGRPQPGAAGLMSASQTLFRPAWAPAVPPQRVYGDEVQRSMEEEDEDEAEDGANPPLIPSRGSLLHPLYPGYGKGRLSNEEHTDTMDVTVPVSLAHSTR